MKNTFDGNAVYEILLNGCLCGVYNNNAAKTSNKQFVEIAKKKDDVNNDLQNNPDDVFGEYICCYITHGNQAVICDLEIRRPDNGKNDEYIFIWRYRGFETESDITTTFAGIGRRTGERTIEVSYTKWL